MSELKAVLDTQVLLRGALARTPTLAARIHEAWRADEFVLLVSDPILAELDAVTARPDVVRLERGDHFRIGRLELLRQITGDVHVPDAVFGEVVKKGAGRPGSTEIAQATWVLRRSVRDLTDVDHLRVRVGRGEAEGPRPG